MALDASRALADDPEADNFGDEDHGEAVQGESPPETPVGRLRAHRRYWLATMHQIRNTCALTLSVIDKGYRLKWDPQLGTPPDCQLRNHPSALASPSFVSEKVMEGVRLGTMLPSDRTSLRCILPLGVATNSAGKQRLIWDGRYVNQYLPKQPFRMETLQREGRALFERSAWGGTCDLSSAYHHVEMHPDSTPFLGFEWGGKFYRFTVLPFGLATAPWLFTKVIGHCARFLRSPGLSLGILNYLDDIIFGAPTAREALGAAQVMINVLRRFGWLIHPTKCVGTTTAVQVFQALGTVVNLATQTFSVPEATVRRILDAARSLATGPPLAPVRSVARLKGLITGAWVAIGPATRVRTRALDALIDSRPAASDQSKRAARRSWASEVPVTAAARQEALWWVDFLQCCRGQPIRPRPFDDSVDGDIYSDASDTGAGAIIRSIPSNADTSSFVRLLRDRAPPGSPIPQIEACASRGIEFMTPLPDAVRLASSTYRELFGVAEFIFGVSSLLRGGRFRLFLDNLGCVFILGGIVPAFAVGGKQWGEFVTGGSPNPDLQDLALRLFQAQLDGCFELQAVWIPRALNTRADYLSRVSEMRHHDYRVHPEIFRCLDADWGPHSVDRFACAATRQTMRFCSQYFHPEADWVDAFSIPWRNETNWLFPPATTSAISRTISHLCADGARGTLIVPLSPWSQWRAILRPRDSWAPFVLQARRLGAPSECLTLPARYRPLFRGSVLFALRVDGRHGR